MEAGYIPPSTSVNPPGVLTEATWNNRHKNMRDTPEERNAKTHGCMHPCCGPSYGPNDRKLVAKNETMHKIWVSFWKAGISYEDAMMVVDDMLKNGILFREEA